MALPWVLLLLVLLHLSPRGGRCHPLSGPDPALEPSTVQVSTARLRKPLPPGGPGSSRERGSTFLHKWSPPSLGNQKVVRLGTRRSAHLGAIEGGWVQVRAPKSRAILRNCWTICRTRFQSCRRGRWPQSPSSRTAVLEKPGRPSRQVAMVALGPTTPRPCRAHEPPRGSLASTAEAHEAPR